MECNALHMSVYEMASWNFREMSLPFPHKCNCAIVQLSGLESDCQT